MLSVATAPAIMLFHGAPAREDVRPTLDGAGFALAVRSLKEAALGGGRPAQLLVVDGGQQPEQALRLCRHLRTLQDDLYVPILFLAGDSGRHRLAGLDAGADLVLPRPFEAAELLAQVEALLRIKERHDQLAAKAGEVHRVNKRLQAAYQQIDQELELARRLQESFLPQSLPALPRTRFAVKYRPRGPVGGDFYDVFRLDEQNVGFYVADAMGHGVPASLLTIFVKKGVRAKEITGQSYRLVPPPEVLHHLNSDLIEQGLSDLPFITMVYFLFNHTDGILQFSRAGHPHPLYLPVEGPPQFLQVDGSLLGVFETEYRLQTHQMHPGDKLLLYTDGMDAAAFAEHVAGIPSLVAAAGHFRKLPIADLVERLAQDLFTQTRQIDDLTILGLEFGG